MFPSELYAETMLMAYKSICPDRLLFVVSSSRKTVSVGCCLIVILRNTASLVRSGNAK